MLTCTSRRVCRPAAVHMYARMHRMCARLASYRSECRSERGRACVEGWEGMHVERLWGTQARTCLYVDMLSTCVAHMSAYVCIRT